MDYRKQKQVIIGLITIIAIAGTSFIAVSIFEEEPEPIIVDPITVNPEFKNLEIVFTKFFEIKEAGTYDAVAYVKNLNSDYGASEIMYEFIFRDEGNEELAKISGISFILPGQSRYIVESALILPQKPATVFLNVSKVNWQRLILFSSLGLSLRDVIFNRDEQSRAIRVSGIVQNRSPYNLKNVEVNVALRDPAKLDDGDRGGEVLAAGTTNMQDLLRDTDRFFKIEWPYLLPYVEIDARVESNFFENSNFIRDYGRVELNR